MHSLASPSKRYSRARCPATETAEIIAKELGGLPLTIVPELRERNSYGVLSGVPKDRAKELFGYILDELKEKPGYSREPLLGAEDFDRFVERVRAGFQLVTDESEAKNYDEIVIVSHGKFTQALADFVFRFGDSVSIDLSAILSVDYTASQSVLV